MDTMSRDRRIVVLGLLLLVVLAGLRALAAAFSGYSWI